MTGPAAKPSKLDQFGLKPPRKGTVRGIIRNVRQSHVEAAFGEELVIEFDLDRGENLPAIAVQMRGNDYSMPIYADWLADIRDPDPAMRPLITRRVAFPHSPGTELVSYTPGQDDPNTPADRFWSYVAVIGPLVAGCGLAGGIAWYFGLY